MVEASQDEGRVSRVRDDKIIPPSESVPRTLRIHSPYFQTMGREAHKNEEAERGNCDVKTLKLNSWQIDLEVRNRARARQGLQ